VINSSYQTRTGNMGMKRPGNTYFTKEPDFYIFLQRLQARHFKTHTLEMWIKMTGMRLMFYVFGIMENEKNYK
jgi:hypothetical protein